MQHAVGQILPNFVSFIASVAEITEQVEKDESRLGALDDVVKAFSSFALSLPSEDQSTFHRDSIQVD